jgi:hypothetical protein
MKSFALHLLLISLPCSLSAVHAQNDDENRAYSENGIKLAEPQTETWEFGLQIQAHGPTTGITASVPVPIQWPEQGIEIIETVQPPQVRNVRYKSIGNGAVKQLVMVIPRMETGDEVTVKVVMKITKHFIEPPKDTSKFVIKKAPSSVRKYLTPSPYIASGSKEIQEVNDAIGGHDLPAWEQVEKIYNWVRENVEYKFDTEIRTCEEALEAGHGDCEELSSIFIAICRARGIPARAVWIPEHTYPEFFLQDTDGNGHWFPCQAAGTYEFGGMSETRPVLQKGDRFKVPGHATTLRYVQPTLTARDAAANPTVQWIMNKVQ